MGSVRLNAPTLLFRIAERSLDFSLRMAFPRHGVALNSRETLTWLSTVNLRQFAFELGRFGLRYGYSSAGLFFD
jgi:hypothetical protein